MLKQSWFPLRSFPLSLYLISLYAFTQGQYAEFFLATSRQSKDHEDARTLCELLDGSS